MVRKLDYKYIFSIHSFSPKAEESIKDLEVGILHNLFDNLADFVTSSLLVLERVSDEGIRCHDQRTI